MRRRLLVSSTLPRNTPSQRCVIRWTIYIDTLYACPDKPYDKEIGVYSAALLFGPYIRPLLSVFAASFVAGFAYAGYLNEQGPVYYIVSVGLTAANLAWQLVTTTDFEKEGTKLFKVCVVGSL